MPIFFDADGRCYTKDLIDSLFDGDCAQAGHVGISIRSRVKRVLKALHADRPLIDVLEELEALARGDLVLARKSRRPLLPGNKYVPLR